MKKVKDKIGPIFGKINNIEKRAKNIENLLGFSIVSIWFLIVINLFLTILILS